MFNLLDDLDEMNKEMEKLREKLKEMEEKKSKKQSIKLAKAKERTENGEIFSNCTLPMGGDVGLISPSNTKREGMENLLRSIVQCLPPSIVCIS